MVFGVQVWICGFWVQVWEFRVCGFWGSGLGV